MLDTLRNEQANLVSMNDKDIMRGSSEISKDAVSQNGLPEFLYLKVCTKVRKLCFFMSTMIFSLKK